MGCGIVVMGVVAANYSGRDSLFSFLGVPTRVLVMTSAFFVSASSAFMAAYSYCRPIKIQLRKQRSRSCAPFLSVSKRAEKHSAPFLSSRDPKNPNHSGGG